MCFFDAAVFLFYKFYRRTTFRKPEEVDFSAAELYDACDVEWKARREARLTGKRNWMQRVSDAVWG